MLYVLLAIKGNAWCWPAGIISAVLYIFFDIQLKYFLDAILQCYYVLAGFYGWYWWTKASGVGGEKPILSYVLKQFLPFLFLGALLTPILGYVFTKAGNAYPYLDAATAIFSFIATYFTAKKVLENWVMWVLIDMVLVVQYFIKDAFVTSAFYAFLAVMAGVGYWQWKKQLQAA